MWIQVQDGLVRVSNQTSMDQQVVILDQLATVMASIHEAISGLSQRINQGQSTRDKLLRIQYHQTPLFLIFRRHIMLHHFAIHDKIEVAPPVQILPTPFPKPKWSKDTHFHISMEREGCPWLSGLRKVSRLIWFLGTYNPNLLNIWWASFFKTYDILFKPISMQKRVSPGDYGLILPLQILRGRNLFHLINQQRQNLLANRDGGGASSFSHRLFRQFHARPSTA